MGRRTQESSTSEVFPGSTVRPSNSLRASYQMSESLGAENRSTEFKKGPGFIAQDFRKNIAKYVCGFVNSKENGQLLLGVDDDGTVIGYECTRRQEDTLRLAMDEAVKDIDPAIFPNDYTIRFVPVTDEFQQQIGNVKVIEVLIHGANIQGKDKLYSTKQGVFIRRDGGIQELNGGAIQEWTRRNFETELNKLKANENNLQKEIVMAQKKLHDAEERLRAKDRELDKKSIDCENQAVIFKQLADKSRQLQDENNTLKQQVEQSGAKSSKTTMDELQEIKRILAQNKKSTVCVII